MKRISRPAEPTSTQCGALTKLVVLHEDNHSLAVSKPAGILTAGDRTGDQTLLGLARRYIKEKYHKQGKVFLGVVHRLDRPVSGVVLFARTSKAARRLSEQFRTGSVTKRYLAWVQGIPSQDSGMLVDFLLKNKISNIVHVVAEGTGAAQRAVLKFRVLERAAGVSLLEIHPQTGRSHQIRVQLATRALPILGDVKYGGPRIGTGQIALHAAELTFEHPVNHQTLSVRASVPTAWRQMLRGRRRTAQ